LSRDLVDLGESLVILVDDYDEVRLVCRGDPGDSREAGLACQADRAARCGVGPREWRRSGVEGPDEGDLGHAAEGRSVCDVEERGRAVHCGQGERVVRLVVGEDGLCGLVVRGYVDEAQEVLGRGLVVDYGEGLEDEAVGERAGDGEAARSSVRCAYEAAHAVPVAPGVGLSGADEGVGVRVVHALYARGADRARR